MTLSAFFHGIGDFLLWTFNLLQNDLPLTYMMNTGIVLLGFFGLFYWLIKQKKFNEAAEANADQLK